MNSCIRYLGLCLLLTAAVSCSGDGGSSGDGDIGNPGGSSGSKVAEINAGNAEQLGAAATEGAKQAVKNLNVPPLGLKTSGGPTVESVTQELVTKIAGRTASMPAPVNCNPGSATETVNPDGSTSVNFVACDYDGLGLIILNGLVTASSNVSGDITTVNLEYVGFIISIAGEDTILNFEASCDTNNISGATSCTFPDVVGFDGRVYDFSDVTISGDGISGYTVTASIVDPDHGSFNISTTAPILFTCPNGQPISGALQFTDGAEVLVTVTFDDCDSYTVSYSGTIEVYSW
jgi:hypothetical protein